MTKPVFVSIISYKLQRITYGNLWCSKYSHLSQLFLFWKYKWFCSQRLKCSFGPPILLNPQFWSFHFKRDIWSPCLKKSAILVPIFQNKDIWSFYFRKFTILILIFFLKKLPILVQSSILFTFCFIYFLHYN